MLAHEIRTRVLSGQHSHCPGTRSDQIGLISKSDTFRRNVTQERIRADKTILLSLCTHGQPKSGKGWSSRRNAPIMRPRTQRPALLQVASKALLSSVSRFPSSPSAFRFAPAQLAFWRVWQGPRWPRVTAIGSEPHAAQPIAVIYKTTR